jgi:hypothetical protein
MRKTAAGPLSLLSGRRSKEPRWPRWSWRRRLLFVESGLLPSSQWSYQRQRSHAITVGIGRSDGVEEADVEGSSWHFVSFLSPNNPQLAEWESLKETAEVVGGLDAQTPAVCRIRTLTCKPVVFYRQQYSHTITDGTERTDENDMHHNSDVPQEDYDSLEVTISSPSAVLQSTSLCLQRLRQRKTFSAIIWPSVWICGIVLVVSLVEMDIVFHLSRLAF